jgi:hypothetical protein
MDRFKHRNTILSRQIFFSVEPAIRHESPQVMFSGMAGLLPTTVHFVNQGSTPTEIAA